MKNVVIKGDVGSHGGVMTTGSTSTDTSTPICRLGDTYNCSIHGPNPIISGVATGFFVDSKAVALNGAITQCGATITATGSSEAN